MTHSDNINPFEEIEQEVIKLHQQDVENNHIIDNMVAENERNLDTIFTDLLSVIDAFNKAESRVTEQFPDNEVVEKVKKRFATAKKKLLEILDKNGVNEIEFPDNMATLEDCQILETEPDLNRPENAIVSIEKKGYRRHGRLLRLAEVITVKN